MRINRDYEQETNLRDLFFDVAYRWRSLLVAALIGAVLLGTFQYVSLESIHREGKKTQEEKQYEIDLQNFHDSINNTRTNIRNYTKLIKEKTDYMEESVYMSLDSQNEWVAFNRYYIQMDQAVLDAMPEIAQEDPADYVAAVYTATLTSGLDPDEMEALLGTGKKEYINELIAAWSDTASNTITVQVIGDSEETVLTQMDYFVNRLMTVSAPKAQEVGAHTLTLMNSDVTCTTDNNLSTKQSEIQNQVMSWQTTLMAQREQLNELEDKEEPTPPGNHIKRFAAIGFILGALVLAAVYALRYILGGRLHLTKELTEHYGLACYGDFAHSRARQPGKGLDKWFENWEFNHMVTDPETVREGICALLREDGKTRRVLLTGTISGQSLEALGKALKAKLGNACALEVRGDLLHDATALEEAKRADTVILVEEKHVSRLSDIAREVELVGLSAANVGGCIVI